MGNSVPNGDGGEWRFKLSSGTVEDVLKIKAYYNGDAQQQIYICGPLALNITLEIDNANIEVTDTGHLICLIGKNNSITVRGSRVNIRIEGEENKLNEAGEQVHLYTNNQVALAEGVELTSSNKLSDENENVADGAPEKLELIETHLEKPDSLENPALIRASYAPAPPDSGSDDQNKDSNSNQAGDVDADPAPATQKDDDDDGGNRSPKASLSSSSQSLSGKRQLHGGDDDDDEEHGFPNKKLMTLQLEP